MPSKTPKFFVVIPARYASTRLPGKPLVDICGKPMIQHVHAQVLRSGAQEVVIATDDERIKSVSQSFGARVCMTRPDHESGTDRVAEVAQVYGWQDEDIVVNVQGDEPLLPPQLVLQVADLLNTNKACGVATLCTPIVSVEEYLNPDIVKVLSNIHGEATCFSRAPLPWNRDTAKKGLVSQTSCAGAFRHLGLYAYRVADLKKLSEAPPCEWELQERLEQLRALWLGVKIAVANAVEVPLPGIDNPNDLERVREALSNA